MEASLEFIPEVLVFISTDKAAQPSGVYGCSKKIGEQLVAEAQRINPETRYRVLRYGNVWGSTGSIATKWRPLIERGEEVTLTDPDASRFFWTVTEAVDLIFQAVNTTIGGCDPIVPKMKAVKMGVVLEACIEHFMQSSGNGRARSEVNIIGLQPGENKTETTDGVIFSDQVEQFTKAEFIKKFLS